MRDLLELGLKLHIRSVDIKVSGEGLESAARKARYNIFEELLEENEQILIGHHSDDVAETFFLRLFRGTGVQGLEGPKIKRRVGKGYLIRPLLSYSKKELLKYANENNSRNTRRICQMDGRATNLRTGDSIKPINTKKICQQQQHTLKRIMDIITKKHL